MLTAIVSMDLVIGRLRCAAPRDPDSTVVAVNDPSWICVRCLPVRRFRTRNSLEYVTTRMASRSRCSRQILSERNPAGKYSPMYERDY
jgi:hypothetical protein